MIEVGASEILLGGHFFDALALGQEQESEPNNWDRVRDCGDRLDLGNGE